MRRLIRKIAVATGTLLIVCASAAQAEPPVKLLVATQYGARVNATTGENFCVEKSGDTCQAGLASSIAGGFAETSPQAVAVNTGPSNPSYGNVYAADIFNNRVEEFAPNGTFVLMFGADVNETTGGGICTQKEIETSGVKCKSGVAGLQAGAFDQPGDGMAVDPASGNVYVLDEVNNRIEEFTEGGSFVLMLGGEVNRTKVEAVEAKGGTPNSREIEEENLCTAASGDTCQAGTVGAAGHGSFAGASGADQILAAGGPGDLLYVGDEHEVQEFRSDGTWVHDLSLAQLDSNSGAEVRAIALDQASGDVFVTYSRPATFFEKTGTIYKFDANDNQIAQFVQTPREANAYVVVEDLAVDAAGRLATVEHEESQISGGPSRRYGLLLDGQSGKRITEFSLPSGSMTYGEAANAVSGIAFNATAAAVGRPENMYSAARTRNELAGYVGDVVGEPVTGSLQSCSMEREVETSVTLDCELPGQINPWGVANTETFFIWSTTEEALRGPQTAETVPQPVCSASCGSSPVTASTATLSNLRPNETIYYELAAYDQIVQPPDVLTGEELAQVTLLVPPKVIGGPNISFVKSFSADMLAELNPENAHTEYFFEYGAPQELKQCPKGIRSETCTGVGATATQTSEAYGGIGATLEAKGLEPGQEYAYRLFAESESRNGAKRLASMSTIGRFTAAQAPMPQALTGSNSEVTTTSALISGKVDPEGAAATYRFELGIGAGADTQYGIVSSGPAGAGSAFVEKTLQLTGLQPATTYAYRIAVASDYGETISSPVTFTTEVPPPLWRGPLSPSLVAIPSIPFPERKRITPCRHGYARMHGRCLKVKSRARKKHRNKAARGKRAHRKRG